jgi:L-fuculose-phosphate aldolase
MRRGNYQARKFKGILGMSNEMNSKQILCDAIIKLNTLGLNHGATGNCSIRKEEGFLISPSGISNDSLKSEHIVSMKMDGTLVNPKKLQPSSEWRFHRDIFTSRKDVNAVVHTHSVYASALSVLGAAIPQFHYMIAVTGGKEIPCAQYAMFGTQELSENILKSLGKQKACLMSNHGLITVGNDLKEAVDIAEEVEHLSKMYVVANMPRKPHLLSDEEMDDVLKRFQSYGVWKKD